MTKKTLNLESPGQLSGLISEIIEDKILEAGVDIINNKSKGKAVIKYDLILQLSKAEYDSLLSALEAMEAPGLGGDYTGKDIERAPHLLNLLKTAWKNRK